MAITSDDSCRPSALEDARTFLGWETKEPILGRKFSKVIFMGPYWSGTNAIRQEVQWRFKAHVLNPDKLEVSARTADLVRSLQDCLEQGPLMQDQARVGRTKVPKGYRLLAWPQSNTMIGRLARAKCPSHKKQQQQQWHNEQQEKRDHPLPPESPDHPTDQLQESEREQWRGRGHQPWQQGGTTDMQQYHELLDCLSAPITVMFGPDTYGACPWWKHAVRLEGQGAIETDDETLVILVMKDPIFWLKSMSKHHYEIKVTTRCRRAGLDPLFGRLEHDGCSYSSAVELWNATVQSFLSEDLFPSNRCVMLRYEDFLFRFWDVMVHLSAFLPAHCQKLKESPNAVRSKSHGREVRNRDEALRYYSYLHNRHCDFEEWHLDRMRELRPELLRAFGYHQVPTPNDICQSLEPKLCSWVPKLLPGDIVAARFHCASCKCRAGGADEGGDSSGEAYCNLGSVWAQVTEVRNDDRAATASVADVELLSEVPREWVAQNTYDWKTVEPADPSVASAIDRAGSSTRQLLPRDWLDLRLPTPRTLPGADLPLTEEGYRAAVSLRSTPKMADFILRFSRELIVDGCTLDLDRRKLLGFARWFSGEALVQSLAQIRFELPGKVAEGWVRKRPPAPTRCLQETERPTAKAD